MIRWSLFSGAVLAGLAVGLGAFGAHALEASVGKSSLSAAEQTRLLSTWEVAVRYQMYHALGLVICGLLSRLDSRFNLAAACYCFLLGTAIFSGCLYAYVLTGVKILGAIVPFGGTAMIVGWVLVARSAIPQAGTKP